MAEMDLSQLVFGMIGADVLYIAWDSGQNLKVQGKKIKQKKTVMN